MYILKCAAGEIFLINVLALIKMRAAGEKKIKSGHSFP